MRRNSLFRTSSFRLTLLYAGLFTASVLILFGIIYWRAAGYAAQDEADDIGEEYAAIQDEMSLAGADRIDAIIANHVRQHQSEQAVYLLQDPSGHKRAGNIPEMPAKDGPMTLKVTLDGTPRAIPAQGFRLTNGDYLLIGQDPQSLREMKDLIARAFGASLVVTLFLATLGGVVIGKTVRGRVEMVARTSRGIVSGDLAQRVPLAGGGDEFDDLAGSINDMLERIEDLMRSMRQVSNDIAHELRTPLTRLRQRLELARRRGATVDALHDALEASLGDIDAILDTFNALLRIAQIESGTRKAGFASVDLSELLETTVETYAPVAEGKGQVLSGNIAPGLQVWGDRGLLVQMVVNLVENAIRHSPEGATVTVTGILENGAVTADVCDTGPGIPEPSRKRVFERLYRLEASRTTPGSGLGLSLVAAIANLHGIVLELGDNAPGLRVRLVFRADGTAPQV